ncbi:Abi family protein [Corynebacterium felinum]|uniref:Abortive infection bacteriophage resistance protein n=1 Tax=Corynebacterium felinum TaxID=131318 RepID=A0ABU2B7T2_9CORY|nr:Abi family protein [Corynebacterium felinum]MDF5821472.1 Abi family protein [Corynebacterium felinum]MDR7354667.1 abortive infection bacteriophage resistance protein [Corynebacterium felinum]WJY94031.1 Abi-like protein [Corynebacterium felinum]
MSKPWKSFSEQVGLLSERGLKIDDPDGAERFLSLVSYYRFSGYFRYWQVDAKNGNNRFIEGASFETIQRLYEAEQALVLVCDEVLHPIEVLLRTQFAYHYANRVAAVGGFPRGLGFTQSPNPQAVPVEEHALANLDRSKEAFVRHYRDEIKSGSCYTPEVYARMPIWVAVEALTFGNLSRFIEASGESGVLTDLAESLHVSPRTLPSQVRSFVYLRNRLAHCAKLWNHSVLDVPGLLPNIERRAKRNYRQFSNHSIYKVLVALDDVATKTQVANKWLETKVEPILDSNPILAEGIVNPKKYGEMDSQLLVGQEKNDGQ